MLAAAVGAEVLGIDIAPRAVERAQERAVELGLPARFVVADALALPALGETFGVVIDSGAFHVFDDAQRPAYVAGLAAVTHPGSHLYLLCFSDQTPGEFGPRRVSREELHDAFSGGWGVEAIEPSSFELPPGNPVSEARAWLVTIRRL